MRTFFKMLSNNYESLKLGRHIPAGPKTLRDSVIKIGAKMAQKPVMAEPVKDDWFSAIGDCPNSELLRLYCKVCSFSFTATLVFCVHTSHVTATFIPVFSTAFPRCVTTTWCLCLLASLSMAAWSKRR